MPRLLLALPLLLAAGCATSSTPYAPVRDPVYQAMGSQPFWQVVIGDLPKLIQVLERIVRD